MRHQKIVTDNPTFTNPNAAVDLIKLRSGKILLIYNDCFVGRNPLTLALSSDGEKTFPIKRNILATGKGNFGYPVIFQAKDGKIHAVWTSEGRKVVNHAVFDEGWIMGE